MVDVNDEVRQELGLDSKTEGVVVVEVISGTAAAQAGVKAMDVITAIDSKKITSGNDLQELVSNYEVGEKITLDILRNGKQISITAALQAKPQQ